jgi:hypothetical protein
MKLKIELKKIAGKGLGVFAAKAIKSGELIESCPTILLNAKERKQAEKTLLNYYIYPWKSTRTASVVLGYGSVINHSFTPNTDWKQNFKTKRMNYRAIKPIKKGEEISVNYNGEVDDATAIDWFDVV